MTDYVFSQQQQDDLARFSTLTNQLFANTGEYSDYVSLRLDNYANGDILLSGMNDSAFDYWASMAVSSSTT